MFRIATYRLRLVTIVSAGFSRDGGAPPALLREFPERMGSSSWASRRAGSATRSCWSPGAVRSRVPVLAAGQGIYAADDGAAAAADGACQQVAGAEGLTAAGLTGQQAARFLAARHAAGGQRPRKSAGLRPLLEYLGGLGVLPPEPPEPPQGRGIHLDQRIRGVPALRAGPGADDRRGVLVAGRPVPGPLCPGTGDPAVVMPGDVTAAVLADASGLSAGAGQHLACALRAFLRYCHVRGLVTADVSAAALGVTGRRTTMLPRGLEPWAGRGAPGRLRPGRAGRPPGLRGHPAAGPARPPGRGSRTAPPGRR